jgi:phage baseplate assembly protein W
MPLERVSKEFKDLSMSLQINPLSYDIIAIKNETAISRSVRNLVSTFPGERFFNQNLGSRISRILFENVDEISSSVIRDEIEDVINNYEPRVKLIDVKVFPNYDNNEFNVTINYYIVGIDALPQELSFALQPTR